ncbi:MAG: NfeD family protein [Alistipes sp.]|nr:NfeD family protein [Alistipes sp.]
MVYIILLIVLGILFLVAELVFLSGSFFGTALSIVCFGGSIWLAFTQYGTMTGIVTVIVVALLSLIATVISLRAKTWQRLALSQEIESSSMELPEQTLREGDRGVTVSRLSPMGKIEVGGKIYEAKSADAFIDQKCEIEVTGFENFSVIVRKIK